jgi:hypothetical protein
MHMIFQSENIKLVHNLVNLDVGGMILLKYILENTV